MSFYKAVPAGIRAGLFSARPLRRLVLLACVAIQPLLTAAADLTADQVARRLENRLKAVVTLRAEFRQFYYSSSTPEPMTGQGQLFISRPDRMRWEYNSPEKQIFLVKDGNFWLYFPEDKQLIKNAARSEVQESEILGLLSGNLSLSERYRVEFNPFPSERKNVYQLRLIPVEDGQFSYLLLEIDRDSWLITKAVFFEPAGGKLEYHFRRIVTDRKIPEEIFNLRVPPDCEIIETGSIK
ncbi:MAG: outer membrane lipoprotein carrier protein LolA [Candidatus Saccharicenans sp.]|nr:outer membrane lipoprotein carrier protein LolA [Candidatus Saccharicenans sp.]MDI6849116.1 outer membrane lipoprotein carrier protein LolA [Candidatus Saccharicenans sp.]